MKFTKNKIETSRYVFLIFLFGLFLRLYKLSGIPNGLYVDEAVIGYNAFSLLNTGKDEFGKLLPVFLRSYGAFSSSLYTYFSAPFIKLFGLSIFSTRSLSALSGSISVIVFFVFIRESKILKSEISLIIGTLLFSVIPWTIFFSRGAFESNLALVLILLSLTFFMLFMNTGRGYLRSVIFLVMSTYAYQSERLIALFLFPIYMYFFQKVREGKKSKQLFVSLALFVILLLPQVFLVNKPGFSMRASGLFFSDAIYQQSQNDLQLLPLIFSYPLSFVREFLANLFSYFSPRNLFWLGDSDLQRSIPELGPLYFWMVIPYFFGFISLAKRLKNEKILFLFLLCVVFAIPASLTKDPFSTLRSLPLVVPILLVITAGIEEMERIFKRWNYIFLVIFFSISLILLWRSYFVLLPKERAVNWDYGYEELTKNISEQPATGFVIDQSRRNPSYILLLFFMKYPPGEFQKVSRIEPDNYYADTNFSTEYKFANIETRNIDWQKDIYIKQILVGDAIAISDQQAEEHFLDKIFEIVDPMGKAVFIGYETDPKMKCRKNPVNAHCAGEKH